MMKRGCVAVALIVLFALHALGAGPPTVLQPSAQDYSPGELTTLTQAIAVLQGVLQDSPLASRRSYLGEWTSLQLAAYTQGILAGMGYSSVLVSGTGWEDGVHTWILVAVNLGSRPAWVPVEACPPVGGMQTALGHVPGWGGGSGEQRFDPRYLAASSVVTLPANALPVATIRLRGVPATVDSIITFQALGSYDRDGTIVIYRWQFGDGAISVSGDAGAQHRYTTLGMYTITLTVVDDRGGSGSLSKTLAVGDPDSEPAPVAPGSGCGCGG